MNHRIIIGRKDQEQKEKKTQGVVENPNSNDSYEMVI